MPAPPYILYAEDDLDDLHLVRESFGKLHQHITIQHASNGLEALQVLQKSKEKAELPALIMLDINMPVMDGRQALIHIKQDQDFKDIPVVIFTTSRSFLDIEFAKKWGAHFMSKPTSFSDAETLAHELVRHF